MMLVPLYPGGKEKALTFSYDDGVRHDLKLIDIFNRFGMKATFNLNSTPGPPGRLRFRC